ncbi:hypothetical protein OBBRIDRAFT_826004, partial [Obba rivulosa]
MGHLGTGPVADTENPLYCPSLDTASFLRELHGRRQEQYTQLSHNFTNIPSLLDRLEDSLDAGEFLDLMYRPLHDVLGPLPWQYGVSSPILAHPCSPLVKISQSSLSNLKRSCAESFSDLLGPIKCARSDQTLNEDSFELSAKAERLQYFPLPADSISLLHGCSELFPVVPGAGLCNVQDTTRSNLESRLRLLAGDEVYGPNIGTETPREISRLHSLLDWLLPGIRLKERLCAMRALTHQQIVDILGHDGHLVPRVLELFRTSEIEYLDLRASIADQDGLNLEAHDLLHVLRKPNSFLFLKELNLANACLSDYDMISIHQLPRLSRLCLCRTGIGNEAIYHLVALRHTLAQLDLTENPEVDDDSIAPLTLFRKLQGLYLFDTSIRMPGLRRLAISFETRTGQTPLDIEAPRECEEYLYNMHKEYVVQPGPSLATDPLVCKTLSTDALRHNLAAHTAV